MSESPDAQEAGPARPVPQGPANVYYGGQAVIEGVMIRGPEHMAIAVRHARGHIVLHSEKLSGVYTGRARRIPLLRGVIVLAETLSLGMRALTYSSTIAAAGLEKKDAPLAPETAEDEKFEFPQAVFWGTMLFAILFAVGFFFALPIVFAHGLEWFDAPRWLIVAVEGIVRLLLFGAYILLIGLMPDVRRVFQYHGAEHMTIHAYEAGQPLNVAAIRRFPKEHQRCGTSFLLIVVIVAFITFFVFDLLVDEGLLVRIASRVVLVPFVAALSYEILRLGARFNQSPIMRAAFVPNIALQKLTTKVPDDSQIEVAIASFELVLAQSKVARELDKSAAAG